MLKQILIATTLTLTLLATQTVSAKTGGDATATQINALKKSIRELARTLGEVKGERKSVQAALRRTDKKIGDLSRDVLTLDKQLKGAEKKLAGLEARRKPLLASLKSRAKDLEQQLQQQYKLGQQPRLQLLLTQRDPEQVSRMLNYYDRVNETLTSKLQIFSEDLLALDQSEKDIRAAQQDIFDHRDQLKLRAISLKNVRKERRQVLANLEKELKAGSQKMKTLQANQARLEKVLAQIQRSIDKVSLGGNDRAFTELKGRLPWPNKGVLTRRFGATQGGGRFDGILIADRAGRPVKAVHHGRVVFSDWLRGYGLLTIIDHGGGYMSLYGHNESLLKDVGEWVSAQETVATVGKSGGSIKPGLYFAVRYKGKPSNPAKWLARR
ncbi:MAG: peptidoglycan DD-metalloendopeptidase family protein [Amphritea sp.]